MNETERWRRLKADPEKYAAYLDKKRRERAARVGYENKRKKKWRESNAAENAKLRKAHHAVEVALKRGTMTRASECSRCGETYGIEAHHPDYDKPLEVIWLCVKCHAKEHHG